MSEIFKDVHDGIKDIDYYKAETEAARNGLKAVTEVLAETRVDLSDAFWRELELEDELAQVNGDLDYAILACLGLLVLVLVLVAIIIWMGAF